MEHCCIPAITFFSFLRHAEIKKGLALLFSNYEQSEIAISSLNVYNYHIHKTQGFPHLSLIFTHDYTTAFRNSVWSESKMNTVIEGTCFGRRVQTG